jgi:type IV pilus assembly protein PilM
LNSAATAVPGTQTSRSSFAAKIDRWLHAMPHPPLVVEIAAAHVAAARWRASRGELESYAAEPLPAGSVMPSPVETNITQQNAVRDALSRVLGKIAHRGAPLALLIPDPAVRVFVLPFETLPRRADDALPLLRWRLKKSVPFDVEETTVSWMRQLGRDGSLEIITAIARQRILREYEELLESVDARPGVVLSSTLAVLPLLGDAGATLLARICGATLTTAVVYGKSLCVYRSTELVAGARQFDPQVVLDEVFPAAAYFQDTWGREIDRAYLAGFGEKSDLFREALGRELNVSVEPISEASRAQALDPQARNLLRQGLDGLAGWAMNGAS